ncbi:LON peptidase substrate-binding domain-containing protein [Shewanella sp. JM162201]|uniref:LON peptidase substrate-binding domain-containing protein n=1 Tax=Shewanella jiangmenensis TaxID=2837387 RepID=A0ABS5V5X6_9GAMM|nr:LON peptidase substrate-binding domain-containing protein [Shewanella jiangmenensis]MBT1445845.1 LON peptidase substrate-binding domain-containing protein [Shewanella jiangmenensis]
MQLALFTLPICLLPGGMTKLRIFEPRYKRLVSESLSSGLGFAMCMLGDDKLPLPIATRADIVDFETLEDGLLGITISGRERVALGPWQSDSDGLKRAEASVLPAWDALPMTAKHQHLADGLRQVMAHFPTQLANYSDNDFNNLTWVCSRWLELLPLSLQNKQLCLKEADPGLTLALINEVIKKS